MNTVGLHRQVHIFSCSNPAAREAEEVSCFQSPHGTPRERFPLATITGLGTESQSPGPEKGSTESGPARLCACGGSSGGDAETMGPQHRALGMLDGAGTKGWARKC